MLRTSLRLCLRAVATWTSVQLMNPFYKCMSQKASICMTGAGRQVATTGAASQSCILRFKNHLQLQSIAMPAALATHWLRPVIIQPCLENTLNSGRCNKLQVHWAISSGWNNRHTHLCIVWTKACRKADQEGSRIQNLEGLVTLERCDPAWLVHTFLRMYNWMRFDCLELAAGVWSNRLGMCICSATKCLWSSDFEALDLSDLEAFKFYDLNMEIQAWVLFLLIWCCDPYFFTPT